MSVHKLVNLHVLPQGLAAVQGDVDAYLAGNGRSCGECRVCCTVKHIRQLPADKPMYEPCPNECASGCAIYDSRPRECREYACMWRGGMLAGDERRRPDRLGLLFDTEGDAELGGFIVAREAWSGAWQAPQARYYLEKLSRQFLIVLCLWGDREKAVMGPEAWVRRWQKVFEERGGMRHYEVVAGPCR